MVQDWIYVSIQELTVQTEEVVEQLEKWEAIPTLGGLDLQSSVHVNGVKGQEVFSVLHHEVRPPRKRLETQHDGPVQKMNVYSASNMRWNAGHQHGRKRERQIWLISKTNDVELLTSTFYKIHFKRVGWESWLNVKSKSYQVFLFIAQISLSKENNRMS